MSINDIKRIRIDPKSDLIIEYNKFQLEKCKTALSSAKKYMIFYDNGDGKIRAEMSLNDDDMIVFSRCLHEISLTLIKMVEQDLKN